MALDENNNFLVTGATGEGLIATDFSSAETSHFQVVKLAFGATSENPTRVTSGVGLPVNLVSPATIPVNLTAVGAGVQVGINGNISVVGVVGATAIGVTATDLDIRSLTAGDPTAGLAPGADFVRIVGYSGGYPVAITGANINIRGLSYGTDSVSVLNTVGVTATNLDIRGITYTRDSIRVLGGVTVTHGGPIAFDVINYSTAGFQTRLLRATTDGTPAGSLATLSSRLSSLQSMEDTVRVVGLSGAYPVDVVPIGLTNINDRTTRVPFHIDDTGALFVNLASGAITVNATADVSGLGSVEISVLRGISLAYPTSRVNVIPITGYTGADNVPVTITGANINIRGLSFGTDSISVLNTVGVTATDLDIRGLTWTSDSVSVLNTVGVTATDLDIRGLTWTSDSVSVLNTVGVTATDLDIRSLTAGTNSLANGVGADFVRVIGESGGWPVSSFAHGLTNINNYDTKVPLKVSDAGELFVNLASGSVSLTANVSGLSTMKISVLEGLSLPYPTGLKDVMPITGYTGSNNVPVTITGSIQLYGAALLALNNIDTNTQRVLGAAGDYVGITGDPFVQLTGPAATTINSLRINNQKLQVQDMEAGSALGSIQTSATAIKNNLASVTDIAGLLKVDVQKISQPTGGTSGRFSVTTGSQQIGTKPLQSGVHFKSDLNNTSTVFVGFGFAAAGQGFPLYGGDQIFVETDNLNQIRVISSPAGATLYYIGT